MTDLKKLAGILSENEKEQLASLAEDTELNNKPAVICVAGAFSTGKTSLLNRLLDAPLLPVAQQESTTLPTFIGYADPPSFSLVANEIEIHADSGDLESLIKNPPADARFLNIGLAQPWLMGVQIVDLPGTGSLDPVKQDFARELTRQADAVIYLLHPRGPSQEDIEELKLLRLLGKKMFIGVAQWDQVEASAKRGERKPDLDEWRQQIALNNSVDLPLVPLDQNGLGNAEVLAFICDVAENLADVRKARYSAGLAPLLAQMIAGREQELELLCCTTNEQSQQFHKKLIGEKEQLLKLREQANEQRTTETGTIMAKWQEDSAELSSRLSEMLASLAEEWDSPSGQAKFLKEGQRCLEQALYEAANLGRNLSENYGTLTVPEVQAGAPAMLLPDPPSLNAGDFLDAARFGSLQARLDELQKQAESAADAPEENTDKGKAAKLVAEIAELERQRNTVLGQPLPMITEGGESGSAGKTLGRMLGEIADIALLFFVPVSAASKTGSYVAKGAKALGMSAKAAKMAGKTAKIVVNSARELHKAGQGKGSLPQELVNKLSMLDMLTLGYWGERLGSMLDGPQQINQHVDREALADRDKILAELDAQKQKKQLELMGLSRMHSAPGQSKAVIEQKMAKVRADMEALNARAEKLASQAGKEAEENWRNQLVFAKERAIKSWERTFSAQLRVMGELLQTLLRDWWDQYIPSLLVENEKRVEALLAQINNLPEQKQIREAELTEAIKLLQQTALAPASAARNAGK